MRTMIMRERELPAARAGDYLSFRRAVLKKLEAKGQALRAVLLWAEREHVGIASVNVETAGAPTATLTGGAVVLPSG